MVGDLHICIPKLAFHAKEVPSGHGTKSLILYLHSPGVRPKVIVRLSGHPLIRDSLSGLEGGLFGVVFIVGTVRIVFISGAGIALAGEGVLD